MSSKKTSLKSPDGEAAAHGELMMLNFNRLSKLNPSNLTEVREQWDAVLREQHRAAGAFLKELEYHKVKVPEIPDLSGLAPGSLEYETAKQDFLEARKYSAKKTREELEDRVAIYSKMWQATSKSARAEVERDKGFEDMHKAQDDPLLLWKIIIKSCTSSGGDESSARLNAVNSYGSYFQGKETSTADYYHEFKSRLDIIKAADAHVPVDADQAGQFIQRLDKSRYLGLIDAIDSKMMSKPKTLAKAYEAASAFVVRVKDIKQAAGAFTADAKPSGGSKAAKKVSESDEEERVSDRKDGRTCYACGKVGHIKTSCRASDGEKAKFKAKRLAEKASRAAQAAHAAAVEEEDSGEDEDVEVSYVCIDYNCANQFAGASLVQRKMKSFHPLEIGFDSMCSKSLFGSKELLRNIRECAPIKYHGLSGELNVKQVGDHEHFGEVYYHAGVPNLLSYGAACRKVAESRAAGDGKYDMRVLQNGTFVWSCNGHEYVFRNNGNNLFTYDCSEDSNAFAAEWESKEHAYIETVAENKKLYTKAEVRAADAVRQYSMAMGGMSIASLMAQARGRRVDGLTFTTQDVVRAFRIYGPSLEVVRGGSVKIKRSKSPGPVSDMVTDSKVTMQVDIMFLSGVAFLVGYVKPMCLLMCNWLKSRSTRHVRLALEAQRGALRSEGFDLVEVSSDSEGAIKEIKHELEEAGCRVSIHGPNTESAEVDVKIKQIKNMSRAATTLPYLLPIVLLMYVVFYVVHKINMLPNSSLAHGYSPMEIFTGRPISIRRDLGATKSSGPMAFGARCEVFEKTTNTLADRTRPAIFLGMKSNSYGSGHFFVLDTEQVVVREQWKPLPMDIGTINLLNNIAKKGPLLPKNLKLIFKSAEVHEEQQDAREYLQEHAPDEQARMRGERAELPDPTDMQRGEPDEEEEYRIISAEEVYTPAADSMEQLVGDDIVVEERRLSENGVEIGGAISNSDITSSGEDDAEPLQREGPERPLYWQRVETNDGQDNEQGGSDSRRSTRPRRLVDRYSPGAYVSATRSWNEAEKLPKQLRACKGGTTSATAGSEYALILSVEKALKTHKEKARVSILKEMQSMHDKAVFSAVKWEGMAEEQRASVIRSSMFLKEKYLASGVFDKLKARLVAGGNMQDRSVYALEETSSPTVSLSSLYLVAALAAKEKRIVSTKDVGSAYLNAKMEKDVFMTLQPTLAKIMVEVDGKYGSCLRSDGSLVVKLDKALYGCIESSKLWYDDLSSFLKSIGFAENAKDKCVFNIVRKGSQLTVCIYVDDLLCTSVSGDNMQWIDGALRAKYKEVSTNEGKVHSYLGQSFDFRREGECKVSMVGYTSDLLEDYKVTGKRVTPAAENLFEINDSMERLPDAASKVFHSRVAKLLYLAMRVRPDILLAVSFLSTRVTKSTQEDWEKLERVLMYLNMTADLGILLRADEGLQIRGHIDASFAVHMDMKGQSGAMITVGTGPVSVSSKKQGLVTKSSTEAELVAISDMLSMVIWTREFLQEQGYTMAPGIIYQDNKSTIAMANRGISNSPRTRHVAIRYFFVKDRIDSGEVVIEHMGTEHMLADGMTKPLQGELFRVMRRRVMGM